MEKQSSDRQRLDSWKEISLYLNRTIRTCYRWRNDLGLPVYRVDQKSYHSRIFAFKKEIDQWFKGKSSHQARRTRAGGRKGGVGKN